MRSSAASGRNWAWAGRAPSRTRTSSAGLTDTGRLLAARTEGRNGGPTRVASASRRRKNARPARADRALPSVSLSTRAGSRPRSSLAEVDLGVDHVADAAALLHPALDRGPEVDAAVEARDRRLFGRLEERAERTRRQAQARVRVVVEGDLAQQVGQHLRDRARLHRVAGGVLGEGGRGDVAAADARGRQPGRGVEARG